MCPSPTLHRWLAGGGAGLSVYDGKAQTWIPRPGPWVPGHGDCINAVSVAWHGKLTSKGDVQGKGKLAVTAFGDLWLHALAFLVLTVTIAIGIWQLIDGAAVVSPLLISILWAAYAAIPPFLLLLYSVTGHNFVMQFACKCAPHRLLLPCVCVAGHVCSAPLCLCWGLCAVSCVQGVGEELPRLLDLLAWQCYCCADREQ